MPDNKDNTTQAKEQVTRHVTLSHVTLAMAKALNGRVHLRAVDKLIQLFTKVLVSNEPAARN
jgi:hypothetical protein